VFVENWVDWRYAVLELDARNDDDGLTVDYSMTIWTVCVIILYDYIILHIIVLFIIMIIFLLLLLLLLLATCDFRCAVDAVAC